MRPITPTKLPETPKNYWIQAKADGWCALVSSRGIYTRHLNDITDWRCFDSIRDRLGILEDIVLHTELVNQEGQGSHLVSKLKKDGKAYLLVHDAMIPNMEIEERWSHALTKVDQLKRVSNDILIGMMPMVNCKRWDMVNMYIENFINSGFEGIVLKKMHSLYYPSKYWSRYSRKWLKLKNKVKIKED